MTSTKVEIVAAVGKERQAILQTSCHVHIYIMTSQ